LKVNSIAIHTGSIVAEYRCTLSPLFCARVQEDIMPHVPRIDYEPCSWNVSGKVFGSRTDRDISIGFAGDDLYRNGDLG
jgi:hypothetical protein